MLSIPVCIVGVALSCINDVMKKWLHIPELVHGCNPNMFVNTHVYTCTELKTLHRTNLRSDLRVKENSLRIDRGKCMGQRLRFPYNQVQSKAKQ